MAPRKWRIAVKGTRLYRAAYGKGADWLESRQTKDGSIDPAGGIASSYKATFALVIAGRLDAAWRLMDCIVAKYVTAPGEFHAEGETDFDRAAAFYRATYIVRAALCLGRFDVASPAALSHLYRYQHRSGGFCASLERSGRRLINPVHTCMGGWLCLYTARLDRAVRAGDFLVRLVQGQPQLPDRFYFHTHARTGRCVTEFEEGAGVRHYSDRKLAKQWFFVTGAIMGFLSDLYRATGRSTYLQTARQLFDYEQGMNPRGFRWPSKCKVGWGAALLYSVTSDPAHRAMAMKVADVTFLDAQHKDGSWDELTLLQQDDGTGVTLSSFETTAEFTFELCEIIKAISGDGHG